MKLIANYQENELANSAYEVMIVVNLLLSNLQWCDKSSILKLITTKLNMIHRNIVKIHKLDP